MRRRAFTLIELLVVIAIIAILAAILFPVFAKAREKARTSSCSSNMKQMGLGIMQYTQDYDEFPVPHINGFGAVASWRSIMQPYIKSRDIFKCPSNTGNINLSADTVYPISYLANGGADDNGNQVSGNAAGDGVCSMARCGRQMSIAAWTSPASLILLAEGNDTSTRIGTQSLTRLWAGHMGRSNYLFADGHVKLLKPSATASTSMNMWSIGYEETGAAATTLAGLAAAEARHP